MFQMVYEEGAAASEAGPSEEARRAAARCEARRYSRPGNGIRQDDRYAGSDQMQYKNTDPHSVASVFIRPVGEMYPKILWG